MFALPLALVPGLKAAEREHRFQHDHVLGTSLDLVISGVSQQEAEAAEAALLAEIDRLCGILSTYRWDSEISQWNTPRSGARSQELRDVLAAYEHWRQRTNGALHAEVGGLVSLWKHAEIAQQEPAFDAISSLLGQRQDMNVDALGKAYVMEKAAAVAQCAVPRIEGLLLNIGGDILLLGNRAGEPWSLGVANSAKGHHNAPALTSLSLGNTSSAKLAIATSGSYERGYRLGDRAYSHILDPRTGRPAEGAVSATVIASDAVTANALATALCVLPTQEGLALVENIPAAECLIVERNGAAQRSSGFAAYERPRFLTTAAAAWPAMFEVSIELTLKGVEENPGARGGEGGGDRERPGGGRGKKGGPGRVRRPYVAVWAEDANKKLVRNIALWANKPRYLEELHTWWSRNNANEEIYSMARATRAPGRYRLVWDGLDEKGHPVPEGSYRICVETNREHGNYATTSGLIECGAKPVTEMLKESVEFEAVTVEYGPHRPTA
jgi:FAD:protein FMN transferase